MREETLRNDLSTRQVKDLVIRLKDSINFRVIHAGKNLWYVGLKADDGPARCKLTKTPFSYGQPMLFDGFEPQTYVGIIRQSSAALVLYKDSDGRSDFLEMHGYYNKLKELVQNI